MPLFPPPLPTPQIVYLTGMENFISNGTMSAGSAMFYLLTVNATVTLTQMRTWFGGTPTGSYDMGIYDATGTNGAPNNLLRHTGANAAAAGMQTQNLTSNLTISPGNYWIAMLDTVADTVSIRNGNAAGLTPLCKTSATNLTVLPSVAGTVVDNTACILISALTLNGYS